MKDRVKNFLNKVGGKKMRNIILLKQAIRKAWSKETCYPPDRDKWTPENPAFGQCAVTALVVQDFFGGVILYCRHFHHYWNRLPDGTEVDLTKEQFGENANPCLDEIVSREYILESERAREAETAKRYLILKHRLNTIIKNSKGVL